MYRHAIIIHMSYIWKQRIAFHIVFEDSLIVKEVHKKLSERFQHLRFGFHVIQTHSDFIESVIETDPYFKGIKYYTDYDQFTDVIESDIKIKPTDVVNVSKLDDYEKKVLHSRFLQIPNRFDS